MVDELTTSEMKPISNEGAPKMTIFQTERLMLVSQEDLYEYRSAFSRVFEL